MKSGYTQYKSTTDIRIDKDCFPIDGQKVSFQDDDEKWHDGEFSDEDGLFVVNENEWYTAWKVLCWCPIENKSFVEVCV